MDGLDLIGVALLATVGAAFVWLGRRARDREIDLNLGRFNANNTPEEAWARMNQRAGDDIHIVGKTMAIAAIALGLLTLVLPAGFTGVTSLAGSIAGPVAVAFMTSRHAVDRHPNWHP